MSYLALARKWRPKNFSEMIGQEHVLRALINALDADRLHHAFLFTGTRGVGKTTIARILAKSINCEAGISSQPCGECSTCREVDEGRFVDLIEVDAASRTKVEDTRDLLDNVQYAPSCGRYKVYLIDEVHMLSASSFNALLKTLEEPPPHVKFLFATTDPQKLPVTILSRCLQFNLRRLSVERISAYCQSLLDKESIPYEDGACKQIGIAADGSMRDALSLLDQSIAYGAGTIKVEDVTSMLGSFDNTLVINLVESLIMNDASNVMQTLAKLTEQAPDLNGVLKAILNVLHGIALYQQVPDACDAMFEEQGLSLDAISGFASKLSAEEIQLFYQIGLTGQRDLDFAPSIRSGLEMVLLRMLAFRPSLSSKPITQTAQQKPEASTATDQTRSPLGNKTVNTNQANTNQLNTNDINAGHIDNGFAETKPNEVHTPVTNNNTAVNESVSPDYNEATAPPSNVNSGAIEATTNAPITIDSPWHDIANAISLGGMDKQVLAQCVLIQFTGNKIELALPPASSPLFNKERETRLQNALSELLQTTIALSIELKEMDGESPSARTQRIGEEKVATAEAVIDDDANVKSLLEAFDGHVQPDSVQPLD